LRRIAQNGSAAAALAAAEGRNAVRNLPAIAALIVVALCAPATLRAAITVNSDLSAGDGLRAQALITDPTGKDTFRAVAIKQVTSSILIRDGNIPNGIQVVKHNLSRFQTYGFGDPLGHEGPPITDPEGPWFGLVWPYRDQYDYFPEPNQPLGDDVGQPFQDQPGVYGFVNIAGHARGGPTDPNGGGGNENLLDRGITGNGLSGPASYFLFDINPLVGPFDRSVRIQIFAAEAIVVQKNLTTGAFSEVRVPIPDFVTTYQLPEPTTLALTSLGAPLLLLRPRRRAA
jgi:hypothetical protein